MRRLLVPVALAVASVSACGSDDGAPPRGEAASAGARTQARVERVVDGDTLVVRLDDGRRRRVRLIGIDTPETKRPGYPVECGGPQAEAEMRRLALSGEGRRARGREVLLVRDPTQDAEDRFGRRLAYVDAEVPAGGARDIGRSLVHAGWARVVEYDGPFRRQRAYEAEQAAARRRGDGIWRLCR